MPAQPHDGTVAPAQVGLYRVTDITARGKFSKTHLYNLLARGHFPEPAIRSGPRFTRWNAADVDAWFADPAGWMARAEATKTVVAGADA
mgnify:CR=1 FL=1